MRKTTLICDRCKAETTWLYSLPNLYMEGLNIKIDPRECATAELCKSCAQAVIAAYRRERSSAALQKEEQE